VATIQHVTKYSDVCMPLNWEQVGYNSLCQPLEGVLVSGSCGVLHCMLSGSHGQPVAHGHHSELMSCIGSRM